MRNLKSKTIFFSGLICLSLIAGVGTFHAFNRGGNDFAVFYHSWQLVLNGQGHDIYRLSPDRFLYAPGFAWILAPLGLFSRPVALMIWCLFKVGLLGFIIKKLSEPRLLSSPFRLDHEVQPQSSCSTPWAPLGVSIWGALVVTRPILIDFEYGQVNLFILAASVWGLLGHLEKKEGSLFWDSIRWAVLTFMAVAKLITLPLLLVPFLRTSSVAPKKLKFEQLGIFGGLFILMILPLLNQGIEGTYDLLRQWVQALSNRGLPTESHNQSFTALLHRYFSGQPTHVIAGGPESMLFGWDLLSPSTITLCSLLWTFATLGFLLFWIFRSETHSPLKWIAILLGLLILPSHLIWKPYFVMSLPLAVLLFQQRLGGATETKSIRYRITSVLILGGLFLAMNFSGFDFLGYSWAYRLEAASLFLIIHIFMLGIALVGPVL